MKHIFKETNQYADALAKFGAAFVASFVVFDNLLSVVENLLIFDKVELFVIDGFAANIISLPFEKKCAK